MHVWEAPESTKPIGLQHTKERFVERHAMAGNEANAQSQQNQSNAQNQQVQCILTFKDSTPFSFTNSMTSLGPFLFPVLKCWSNSGWPTVIFPFFSLLFCSFPLDAYCLILRQKRSVSARWRPTSPSCIFEFSRQKNWFTLRHDFQFIANLLRLYQCEHFQSYQACNANLDHIYGVLVNSKPHCYHVK